MTSVSAKVIDAGDPDARAVDFVVGIPNLRATITPAIYIAARNRRRCIAQKQDNARGLRHSSHWPVFHQPDAAGVSFYDSLP
jgi:hypothetical protein